MTKADKLLQRILNNPADVRFQELDKLLKHYGFEMNRIHGDHYIYKKAGYRPISVPHTQPVKSYVVREVIRLLRILDEFED